MGDLFYREQSGPADSEMKQPDAGANYRADSPSTYSLPGDSGRTKPPGNNSDEHRDQSNPSSAKVIPSEMGETLRNQVTYLNTASARRVASRYAGPRSRTAATMGDISGRTGPEVHERAQGLTVNPKRFSPTTGFWSFTVLGSKGTPYYVRLKGVRKSKKIKNLSKSDVKCSCSCPFWRWQGPEHWGKTNGFLYGRPRGTASLPVIKDPKEKHWACKHILAAISQSQT